MLGSYEHGNTGLSFIRGKFLDSLQDYQPWRIILLNFVVIIIDRKFVEYYSVLNFRVLLFIWFISSTKQVI